MFTGNVDCKISELKDSIDIYIKKAGKIPITPASIPENTASFLDLKCLVQKKIAGAKPIL